MPYKPPKDSRKIEFTKEDRETLNDFFKLLEMTIQDEKGKKQLQNLKRLINSVLEGSIWGILSSLWSERGSLMKLTKNPQNSINNIFDRLHAHTPLAAFSILESLKLFLNKKVGIKIPTTFDTTDELKEKDLYAYNLYQAKDALFSLGKSSLDSSKLGQLAYHANLGDNYLKGNIAKEKIAIFSALSPSSAAETRRRYIRSISIFEIQNRNLNSNIFKQILKINKRFLDDNLIQQYREEYTKISSPFLILGKKDQPYYNAVKENNFDNLAALIENEPNAKQKTHMIESFELMIETEITNLHRSQYFDAKKAEKLYCFIYRFEKTDKSKSNSLKAQLDSAVTLTANSYLNNLIEKLNKILSEKPENPEQAFNLNEIIIFLEYMAKNHNSKFLPFLNNADQWFAQNATPQAIGEKGSKIVKEMLANIAEATLTEQKDEEKLLKSIGTIITSYILQLKQISHKHKFKLLFFKSKKRKSIKSLINYLRLLEEPHNSNTTPKQYETALEKLREISKEKGFSSRELQIFKNLERILSLKHEHIQFQSRNTAQPHS